MEFRRQKIINFDVTKENKAWIINKNGSKLRSGPGEVAQNTWVNSVINFFVSSFLLFMSIFRFASFMYLSILRVK
jgi:hypothetical protein